MLRFYRVLLQLYPSGYRREFGEEMLAVLAEANADARQQVWLARFSLASRESAGLLRGAFEEHLLALTGSYPVVVFPNRRTTMRSEFRFPKTTVGLMIILLVAVIVTIEKAKAISQSIPPGSTPVGPIHPEYIGVVPAFLMALGGASLLAAIGWAILFALRRSGIHRLSSVHREPAPTKPGSPLRLS